MGGTLVKDTRSAAQMRIEQIGERSLDRCIAFATGSWRSSRILDAPDGNQ
jgi:hypothetical protein